MDPARVAIRCAASFIFLLAVVRLSGKRCVSEATAFDFVLSLIVGDLVDDAILAEVPVSHFIVASGTLVMIEIIVSILAHTNDRWMWWVEGKPGIILVDGRLNPEVMRNETLNERDVIWLLRMEGLEKEKWIQIRLASIEAEGQTAVLKKQPMKTAQKRDFKWLKKRNA